MPGNSWSDRIHDVSSVSRLVGRSHNASFAATVGIAVDVDVNSSTSKVAVETLEDDADGASGYLMPDSGAESEECRDVFSEQI